MKVSQFLFGLMLTLILGQNLMAQETKKTPAISGYDPVSYFTAKKPLKGKPEFKASHNGLEYHFASASNRNMFKKNPEKYAPQYGGWCAYGIAQGSEFPVNPTTYKILNGKLYLFYNHNGTNTLELWNKDEANLLKAADKKWKQ